MDDRTQRRNTITDVISALTDAIAIYDSGDISWETKFDLIFGIDSNAVYPGLKALNLTLDQAYSDGSYQDDTVTYLNAAKKMLEELIVVQATLGGGLS